MPERGWHVLGSLPWCFSMSCFGSFSTPVTLDGTALRPSPTLLMTLFIQRSEHRDTQAIHAKLDELLRAHGEARNQITHLDEKEPEQVEAFRSKAH